MLTICRETYEAVLAQLGAVWPREGCGLLGGIGERACRHVPVANVARRPDRFLMAPAEQIAALYSLEDAGARLLAIYHSHPAGPAHPSPRDVAEAAWSGVAHLIVSLADPRTPAAGVFRLDGGRITRIAWSIE